MNGNPKNGIFRETEMRNMKYLTAFILLLLCLGAGAGTRRALFLGNSHTYVNDLPGLVAQLAESAGDTLIYDSNTPGGYTLFEHSTNPTSLAKIVADEWDFVILQDQSEMPAIPYYRDNWTNPGARALDSAIADNCSRTMFYMTWGWRGGGLHCIDTFCSVDFADYEEMQDTVEAAYMRIAEELSACCAPVGAAWKNAIRADPTLDLWAGDGCHADIEGSYLAACVFYAMIFRSSPRGLAFHSTLSAADAGFFQWIADSTVFDPSAAWFDDSEMPDAAFDVAIDSDTARFSNASTGAIEFIWQFGDGATSFDIDPVHIYGAAGEYYVTLIASDGCLRDYAVDTISIATVGIAETGSFEGDFAIYPNPFNGNCRIMIDDCGLRIDAIEIYDINGRRVESVTELVEVPGGTKLPSTGSGSELHEVIWQPDESIGSGIYLVRAIVGEQSVLKRIIYLK